MSEGDEWTSGPRAVQAGRGRVRAAEQAPKFPAVPRERSSSLAPSTVEFSRLTRAGSSMAIGRPSYVVAQFSPPAGSVRCTVSTDTSDGRTSV